MKIQQELNLLMAVTRIPPKNQVKQVSFTKSQKQIQNIVKTLTRRVDIPWMGFIYK